MTAYKVHRRMFFKQIATVSIGLSGVGWFGSAHADVKGFEALALFLTGRRFINAAFLQQTYQALQTQDKDLDQNINRLSDLISQQKITKVEALMPYLQKSKQAALATSAQQIIAALYTGIAGQGDKATVINYQMALMFEPTLGVITIPTFVGARPEYWSAQPE
jgi:hypothetical protein